VEANNLLQAQVIATKVWFGTCGQFELRQVSDCICTSCLLSLARSHMYQVTLAAVLTMTSTVMQEWRKPAAAALCLQLVHLMKPHLFTNALLLLLLLLLPPRQRLVGYLAGDNEDCAKLPPTVPLNSVLLTADRASQTVKGHFFFAIYLPEEVQVSGVACLCFHVAST
jgi:hypothetical protein